MINFFCIGTQKSGTTTLHDILSQHPDIFLPEQKETHFFCRTDFYNKGYDWYKKSYFKNANDTEYIGEIDPDYLFFEKTIERIAENCSVSDTKFIVVLRNPVNRAVSHYNMTYRRGLEQLSFNDAIREEKNRTKVSEKDNMHYSYISRGLYYEQIDRYLNVFPKEKFLFLTFEKDIKGGNLQETVNTVCSFLGIPTLNVKDVNKKSNVAVVPKYLWINRILRGGNPIKKYLGPMFNEEIRKKIMKWIYKWNKGNSSYSFSLDEMTKKELFEKHYYEDVVQLSNLLGIDFLKIWYEK
jgi:hypothetical protein